MGLEGRGARYGNVRGIAEWILTRAYGDGWPAGLVRAVGLQREVRVVRHRLVSEKWPRGCPPLRLAFASDLHAGPTTHPSLLDAAASALVAAAADVLLLGGDYVFLSSERIAEVADRVARVPAPLGRFGVMGNHDLWADDRAITRALTGAGVRVMVNEHAALPEPFDHVSICGLDDPWTGIRDQEAALRDARPFRIVLVHAPEALLDLEHARFDLAVCGHTHGGHIALPGGIPIVAPGPLSRRYAHGRFDLGAGKTMIVSRGVGATEVPLRWNAEPDVLVIEITA